MINDDKTRSYIAFISYRHLPLDKEAAERIQKKIESFAVPKEFRDQTGGKSLGMVFRDEDELPTSASLTGSICEALDHSEYLIVICTPDLPHSKWCEQEISYFLRTHDRDHIIAVLADGTPEVSFSPLMLHTFDDEGNILDDIEPLAANIAGKDHTIDNKVFKKEIVRIYAALIGCPFDTLWQRSKRRRRNRILAVSCAAAALMVIFSGVLINRYAVVKERQALLSSAYADSAAAKLARYDEEGAVRDALAALESDDPDIYDPRACSVLAEALNAYQLRGSDITKSTIAYQHTSVIEDLSVTGDEKYILIRDANDMLRCLDAENYGLLWETATDDPAAEIYTEQFRDCLICKSADAVCCISLSDGNERWAYYAPDVSAWDNCNHFQAISGDGSLFAVLEFIPDESDSAAAGEAQIVILNTEDGSVKCRVPLAMEGPGGVRCALNDISTEYAAAFSDDNSCFACMVPITERSKETDNYKYMCFMIDIKSGTVTGSSSFSPQCIPEFYGMTADAKERSVSFVALLGSYGGMKCCNISFTEEEPVLKYGDTIYQSFSSAGGVEIDLEPLSRNGDHMLTYGKYLIVISDNLLYIFDSETCMPVNSLTFSDTIVNAWWQDREDGRFEVISRDGWIVEYTLSSVEGEIAGFKNFTGFQADQDSILRGHPLNGGWNQNEEDGCYLTVSENAGRFLLQVTHPCDPNEEVFALPEEDCSPVYSIQLVPDSDTAMIFFNGNQVRTFDLKSGEFSEAASYDFGWFSENIIPLDSKSFLMGDMLYDLDGSGSPYGEAVSVTEFSECRPQHHIRMSDGRVFSWSEEMAFIMTEEDGVMPTAFPVWIDGKTVGADSGEIDMFICDRENGGEPLCEAGRNGLLLLYGRRLQKSPDPEGKEIYSAEERFSFYLKDADSGSLYRIESPYRDSEPVQAAVGTKKDIAAAVFEDGHISILRNSSDTVSEPEKQYQSGEIVSVCFSEGDDYLFVLTASGTIDIYDTDEFSLVRNRSDFYAYESFEGDVDTVVLDSAVPAADGNHLCLNLKSGFRYCTLILDMSRKNEWCVQSSFADDSLYDPSGSRICRITNNYADDNTRKLELHFFKIYGRDDLKAWAEETYDR